MSRHDAHRYLIAYDVPNDRRRTRLSKVLSSYGERMQFSVFLADAGKAKLVDLTNDATGVLDMQEDSLLVCDLGPSATANSTTITRYGRQPDMPEPHSFIV